MNSQFLIGYSPRKTFLHRLNGSTKLIGFVALSLIGMITYDTRFLAGIFLFSGILFYFSKISYQEIALVLKVIMAFAALNLIMVYVFAPGYGMTIYGTQHMLWGSPQHYFNLSWEEVFYIFNLFLKYTFAVPLALIFLLTTNPSEFAASLNRIGIPYRTSYAVEIALRYIPSVQRDYRTISLAQQARGYEISKKAKLRTRIIGSAQIILPLIFTSLDRIEVVSQAMELRRFGHNKKRTWYLAQPFVLRDFLALATIAVIVIWGVVLFKINGGRFWNPFK
ncbi:energy-coupling factor transporter transmembrane protein EcfT [Liquorilactobacillus satsumensis]|uniref:energy-coupling factor transporter transmembrane component T family protein n=1 Tax=Liquorilactobacillus satsumensis TaxID=259059 RepID=UPI0021C4C329|nr:energy-coupling factor transporter transmembrane component T [Liquorilactobacillus satsumensis]MCP9311752.1 energy-coupling factor transporter transmembrane protein EcfT [Liquorilactobacillus satsumensis]MCP9358885.1 energy-coupling factor transporter transmembrane protein EcfT [Liquorilactobacillus satsumensis]